LSPVHLSADTATLDLGGITLALWEQLDDVGVKIERANGIANEIQDLMLIETSRLRRNSMVILYY